MIIEHVAFVVQDPEAMVEWYSNHLGLREIRRGGGGDIFVSDESEETVLQLEDGRRLFKEAGKPDYGGRDAQELHLAFKVEDVRGVCERLIQAGASLEGEIVVTDDGDEMALLRDPWGLAFQVVKRKEELK